MTAAIPASPRKSVALPACPLSRHPVGKYYHLDSVLCIIKAIGVYVQI